MTYVDIHTHIDQHDPVELPAILERARDAGVGAMFVAGITVESSRRCVQLAEEHPELYAGVGVHPQDLKGDLTQYELDELDRLAGHSKTVVMSEVGLDHQAKSPSHDLQERALRAQIEIASGHRLPVVFHVREEGDDPEANSARGEALRILRETNASALGGAAHYFQGRWEFAKAVMDLGFYISLAKPLLRLPYLQDVAVRLPHDMVVLETDAYPQPFKSNRDNWTEPRDVPSVASRLAELWGVEVGYVAEVTTRNALQMLGDRACVVDVGP
jgi:TatD DNase family protein